MLQVVRRKNKWALRLKDILVHKMDQMWIKFPDFNRFCRNIQTASPW